jgi:hypothetical protein
VTKLSSSGLPESKFGMPLNRGYSDTGLTFGCVMIGKVASFSSFGKVTLDCVSSDTDRKYRGLSDWCSDNDFETCAGGKRLMRLDPAFLTASNSNASFLL